MCWACSTSFSAHRLEFGRQGAGRDFLEDAESLRGPRQFLDEHLGQFQADARRGLGRFANIVTHYVRGLTPEVLIGQGLDQGEPVVFLRLPAQKAARLLVDRKCGLDFAELEVLPQGSDRGWAAVFNRGHGRASHPFFAFSWRELLHHRRVIASSQSQDGSPSIVASAARFPRFTLAALDHGEKVPVLAVDQVELEQCDGETEAKDAPARWAIAPEILKPLKPNSTNSRPT